MKARRFGEYLLLDRLALGGMAEVWRAKVVGELARVVAIKRILPNIAEDDEFRAMFIDEAKITVQLTHANVAQVYDLGKIEDDFYIAMEYVPGRDLRAIFDRCRKAGAPAPVPLVCYVLARLCEGLDYAHRKADARGKPLGIVHRDVSPQNCLVSYDGEVKLIDFGIAKAANKKVLTEAGIIKGKYAYMSPEQISCTPIDRRSDVFAAGIVLWEMLAGQRLFVGETAGEILERVCCMEIPSPRLFNRRVPEELERIVLTALAREPAVRYQWASDLSEALQRLLFASEQVFSRKDLAQYMRSTFAEEIEREKVRQLEYADVQEEPAHAPPDATAVLVPAKEPAETLVTATTTPTDPVHLPEATPPAAPAPVAIAPAPPERTSAPTRAPAAALALPPSIPEPRRSSVRLPWLALGALVGIAASASIWLLAGRGQATTVPTVLASDPSDAEMRINGEVVKAQGTSGLVAQELEVGRTYELVVVKPGFVPWTKAIRPSAADRSISEFAQLRREP